MNNGEIKPPVTATTPAAAALQSSSTWEALRQMDFRRFWIFSFLAFIGASLQNVGAAWLMVDLGGSHLQVSLVQGIMSLSVVLAALPAGALADLHDRRLIMLISLAGLMISTTAIGALGLATRLDPSALLALTFLFGMASALMTPAMQATVRDLVPTAILPSAVTLNGMSGSAARSIGPAFAGLLIGAIGAGLTLIANFAAFIGLWIVVARWQSTSRNADDTARADGVLRAVRRGLQFAIADPPFRGLLLRTLVCFLGTSALLALLPSLVAERFEASSAGGARQLGLLLSCYGIGSVASSLGISRLSRRLSRRRLVVFATLASGVAILGVAALHSLALTAAAMVLAGASWLLALTSINIDAQLMLPRELLARGLSISMMALMVSLTAGSILWGALATRLSLDAALYAAAGVNIAVAMALLNARPRS